MRTFLCITRWWNFKKMRNKLYHVSSHERLKLLKNWPTFHPCCRWNSAASRSALKPRHYELPCLFMQLCRLAALQMQIQMFLTDPDDSTFSLQVRKKERVVCLEWRDNPSTSLVELFLLLQIHFDVLLINVPTAEFHIHYSKCQNIGAAGG